MLSYDKKFAKRCLFYYRHDHFYYISKSIDIVGDHWTREKNLDDVGFDPEKDCDEDDVQNDKYPVRVVKSGTDFREFSLLKLETDTDPSSGQKYIKSMSGTLIKIRLKFPSTNFFVLLLLTNK